MTNVNKLRNMCHYKSRISYGNYLVPYDTKRWNISITIAQNRYEFGILANTKNIVGRHILHSNKTKEYIFTVFTSLPYNYQCCDNFNSFHKKIKELCLDKKIELLRVFHKLVEIGLMERVTNFFCYEILTELYNGLTKIHCVDFQKISDDTLKELISTDIKLNLLINKIPNNMLTVTVKDIDAIFDSYSEEDLVDEVQCYGVSCTNSLHKIDADIEYSVIIECVDLNKRLDTSENINTDNCLFYCKHLIND